MPTHFEWEYKPSERGVQERAGIQRVFIDDYLAGEKGRRPHRAWPKVEYEYEKHRIDSSSIA